MDASVAHFKHILFTIFPHVPTRSDALSAVIDWQTRSNRTCLVTLAQNSARAAFRLSMEGAPHVRAVQVIVKHVQQRARRVNADADRTHELAVALAHAAELALGWRTTRELREGQANIRLQI